MKPGIFERLVTSIQTKYMTKVSGEFPGGWEYEDVGRSGGKLRITNPEDHNGAGYIELAHAGENRLDAFRKSFGLEKYCVE